MVILINKIHDIIGLLWDLCLRFYILIWEFHFFIIFAVVKAIGSFHPPLRLSPIFVIMRFVRCFSSGWLSFILLWPGLFFWHLEMHHFYFLVHLSKFMSFNYQSN